MKTRVLFSIIAVVFSTAIFTSCEKEDSVLPLEGDFSGSFVLSDQTFNFHFRNVEQNGENLYGNFSFSDGSGYSQFGPMSEIDWNHFKIEFFTSPINFKFTGEVNKKRDYMDGDNVELELSGFVSNCGHWSATKTSLKFATENNLKSAGETDYERFVKMIQNNRN
jgi:hypothetical protein